MSNHHENDAGGAMDPAPEKRRTNSRGTIIDQLIGQQIRQLRKDRAMSQQDLAKVIGVSYQQIQKYESGHNRIAVSTLLICSVKTGQSIEYFIRTARAHLEKA